MMLRIAICDDMPEHGAHLSAMLAAEPLAAEAIVNLFGSPGALLERVDAGSVYDVFFLDVELGDESGIRLAQQINRRYPAAQIIFVTANIVNAVDVDEANHTYFLLKPVASEKLHKALERTIQRSMTNTDKRLRLALLGGGEAIVSSGELIYCERSMRTTALHCVKGTLYAPVKLDALEAELPARLFVRPHNSYLVNLMHVTKLERSSVTMDSGISLPISNQRRQAFRDAMSAYASRA